jgi:5'-methylthioadenosine phosphorylase
MVVANLLKNVATSKSILQRIVPNLAGSRSCTCGSALESAIITARDVIPQETRERLAPLVGKYLGA